MSPARKLLLWLLVIATAALAIWQTKPPHALDESAPAEEFSAARAKLHLAEIAREPHPIGSAANQRVRDYLMQQLVLLGAEVRLEKTTGITNSGRQIYAAAAENIVGTIKGTASGRAVMLATHYDSVPQGPGAADAGSGVVAILEAVRALRAGAPLRNDLVILYTDGEEEGLVGAAGFVRDHPDIAQRVGVVLNLEARGSSGPALMFETSDGNGWVTREFARAAPYPFASSLAYAVYKRMPNDTDMTVFKKAGLIGLNFAFSGTVENYHTARDTPENLDPRSLQHIGANALALARHFGQLDLQERREPDRIYFNWFGSLLVDYPPWIGWLLLVLNIALFVAAVMIGHARGVMTTLRMLAGVPGFVVIAGGALAGVHSVWWLVRVACADRLLVGDTWSNALIALACVAAGFAFALALQASLGTRLRGHNSTAGQLLAVTMVTTAVTFALPSASYLFHWPLLGSLAALLAVLRFRVSILLSFAAAVPTLLIISPLMYQLFVVLGLNTISLSVLALLLCFAVATLSPLIAQIGRPVRVIVPSLLLCSMGLAMAGAQLSRFSPEHPRRNSLFYSVNADAGAAAWVSNDDAPDVWTTQFLTSSPRRDSAPEFTTGSPRVVLTQPAELLPLDPPAAHVVSDSVAGGGRVLKLHVASPRNANTLLMRLAADVKLLGVAINGREHVIEHDRSATGPWLLRYHGVSPEGLEVELRLASPDAVNCWLSDRSAGLPAMNDKSYTARPADMTATYGSDVTLVTRRLVF